MMPDATVHDAVDPLGLEAIDFDVAGAYECGLLRPLTRGAGLFLADRACLALAKRLASRLSRPTAPGSVWRSRRMSAWFDSSQRV